MTGVGRGDGDGWTRTVFSPRSPKHLDAPSFILIERVLT